jgi:hypothetical protein
MNRALRRASALKDLLVHRSRHLVLVLEDSDHTDEHYEPFIGVLNDFHRFYAEMDAVPTLLERQLATPHAIDQRMDEISSIVPLVDQMLQDVQRVRLARVHSALGG